MTREEYTDQVLAALRRVTTAERESIRAEIDAHMEDHICALLDLGYEPELAEERTMTFMGDPVEVGRELDRQYPLRWLVLCRTAMVLTLLLVLLLARPMAERIPDAWESLCVRWAPKTVLDMSRVREGIDPLGLETLDMAEEVTIRDVHFKIYQLAYEPEHDGGNVRMAVACWRTNPFQEKLAWMDGYFGEIWVNGEKQGFGGQYETSCVTLYSVWADPGDLLTITWEAYGETGTTVFLLPEAES